MLSPTAFIHPSSIVDTGAVVGEGTRIWHYCHLMPGAVVGSNCTIGQNVYIDNNVIIGNGVKVQNNVSLYNSVSLADEVFIGPSVVFTNVINPRAFIERKQEFRPTLVGRGASIGANATIICGVSIGEYAMVGAGAVVTRDVPPYALVMGNPARVVGKVDREGNTVRE
ncbi:N-acetyltransferase [Flavihumibacter rivuli]|uniref:acyltransferase n=1 Tax=Flavihumibacter rivuli TaxID=2838156 RepID=UPI001BDF6B4A|nr:acyltransferase [Flavihumibacter rivuli]ULQ56243.1 N-acetyltransferase [Flavihumibacter rivuli]